MNRLAVLLAPRDAASLAVYRVLFGGLMFVSALRFLLSDWIPRFYGEPSFFFKYWGMSWVPVAPEWAMYAIYGALAALALLVAVGAFYRVSIVLFALGFTYTQLLDVTNYLNHYHLVVLLSWIFCFLPLHRTWSVDGWRRPEIVRATIPAWCLYLVRFQIAVVYCFAGLAKLNSDWLLHAQPLGIWLTARTETPLVGALFDREWLAYAMSWGGFLFDSTIVFWLSWRRARPYAYAIVVFFHVMTDVLFNIGMFPYIMMFSATMFFDPGWPRRLLARLGMTRPAPGSGPGPGPDTDSEPDSGPRRRHVALALALAFYGVVQIAVPLRHHAYPGDVLWNEEGMRFSWKVMLREKHGSVTFHVRFRDTGKEIQVSPRRYLNHRQEREMAGQPDLILQLAHHIADDLRHQGLGDVEVRAEALVSLNGRPARPMIDPQRDLSRVSDGLAAKDWILSAPTSDPIHLRALARP